MLLTAIPVQARRGGGGAKKGTAQNNNSVAGPGNSMNNDPNAGINQTSGDDELGKDAAAMDMAEKKVDAKFEQSADWTKANDAFHTAQDEFNLAKTAAIKKLKTDAAYTAACDASTKASANLDAVRKNPGSSTDDVSTAAAESFAAKSKVTQMEKDACTVDPTVASAKASLAQATATLAKLREQEHDAVLADADYQAAKSKFDAAKASKTSPAS